MQVKKLLEKYPPGSGDLNCEIMLVILKLKIIAERVGVVTQDEFEAGKCNQCDKISAEAWALQDMLENCIDDLEHIKNKA